MNKEDVKLLRARIADLQGQIEANIEKMKELTVENRSMAGGIMELRNAIVSLAKTKPPAKKEKAKKK